MAAERGTREVGSWIPGDENLITHDGSPGQAMPHRGKYRIQKGIGFSSSCCNRRPFQASTRNCATGSVWALRSVSYGAVEVRERLRVPESESAHEGLCCVYCT